jgi:SWI/SNF-related matrix-associated actin-dependent regulator of chromatin subfamily A3
MGMGKSLSALAVMVQTLEEGRAWAEEQEDGDHKLRKLSHYAHSTLIIVPSACKPFFALPASPGRGYC